jgi:hypothetical protein
MNKLVALRYSNFAALPMAQTPPFEFEDEQVTVGNAQVPPLEIDEDERDLTPRFQIPPDKVEIEGDRHARVA